MIELYSYLVEILIMLLAWRDNTTNRILLYRKLINLFDKDLAVKLTSLNIDEDYFKGTNSKVNEVE